jgi:C-terminal processing protease CtpA/Prc
LGEATYGVANATLPYQLRDGAQLFLVVAVDLDRNGVEYPAGVIPDQIVVPGGDPVIGDGTLEAARRWLLSQQACQ